MTVEKNIVSCSKCGAEMSGGAISCPQCNKTNWAGVIATIIVLGALVWIILGFIEFSRDLESIKSRDSNYNSTTQ